MGTPRLLAAITTSVALLLSSVACSSSSDGPTGSGATLEMWTFKQTHVKPLQAAAASFKEKTGITVNITAYTPDDAFKSKVMSAAATKNVADVLEVHAAGEDFVLGGAGILADITSNVDSAWQARFLKGTADAGRVSPERYQRSLAPKAADVGIKTGQLFSIPFTSGTFGIVYASKAKLTAAGLNPAAPPKTWAELISWLRATTAKDPQNGGITIGLKASSTGFNWILQPLAYAYLGKDRYEALFGKDSGKIWGNADGEQVLALYDKLTPYWTPGSQTLGIDDADRAFAQGKSAFDVGGTFTLAAIQQNGMNPSDLIAFGLPPAEGGQVTDLKLAPLALTGLSVSATSKQPEAAIKWLDYLTSVDQAGAFAKASLDLPGVDLGAKAASLLGPDLAALQKVFDAPGPNTYNPDDMSKYQSPVYDQAIAGDALVKMSPLKQVSVADTNKQLGQIISDSWK
ncbi:extracellular solute-binding protein [Actinocrispum sp. NPDC049592]|uniref:ABC transporter substrate-binding protein n=1 Tax=Actinocrispum sp. NPDC049592 TaxID=3154835 RepID=UPI003443A3D4